MEGPSAKVVRGGGAGHIEDIEDEENSIFKRKDGIKRDQRRIYPFGSGGALSPVHSVLQ